jgi:hypothetical protein
MTLWTRARFNNDMTPTVYRDLAEFGLPFITPDHSAFAALAADIQSRPQPFGPVIAVDMNTAAVLMNQSGKTIVALSYIWRYTTPGGETRTSRHSSFGSSMQLDVLAGRTSVIRDRSSFILPGSKRLIIQDGIFGDNLDVLPPEPASHGGGWSGSGAGRHSRVGGEEIVGIELQLDVVFFDDGLCVGPDESDLFGSVTGDLDRQRDAAVRIVEALRDGASAGRVFDILRPLARHTGGKAGHLLSMFANTAIHRLVNASDPELMAWFEHAAQPSTLRLRRQE